MERLIRRNSHNAERIRPYIGGEEVTNSPTHSAHRYAIDFEAFPRERKSDLGSWKLASEKQRREWLARYVVPNDYPLPVAGDWPELLQILERRVRPIRLTQASTVNPDRWWMHARPATKLKAATSDFENVLVINCGATPQFGVARMKANLIFAHTLTVFAFANLAPFSILQCRVHEVWARLFSSTLEDRLRYAPSDCFETFPLPEGFPVSRELKEAARTYHDHRAALMVARNEGLTKTYNRFQ